MSQACIYCGTPRDGRMSCCDENHWEETEPTTKDMINALVDMDKFELIFIGDNHGKD
jgi:hypothetical protein